MRDGFSFGVSNINTCLINILVDNTNPLWINLTSNASEIIDVQFNYVLYLLTERTGGCGENCHWVRFDCILHKRLHVLLNRRHLLRLWSLCAFSCSLQPSTLAYPAVVYIQNTKNWPLKQHLDSLLHVLWCNNINMDHWRSHFYVILFTVNIETTGSLRNHPLEISELSHDIKWRNQAKPKAHSLL